MNTLVDGHDDDLDADEFEEPGDDDDNDPVELEDRLDRALTRVDLDENLKKPVGQILSAIALQGISAHAKKRPISALDDQWLRSTWERIDGLLRHQPRADESPAWRQDVQYLEAAAKERGVDLFAPAAEPKAEQRSVDKGEFKSLALKLIVESPWNPRKHFDAPKLEELAASIREHGVLTPLLARPTNPEAKAPMYELAAGHRRFRAAKLAGLTELPVVVRVMTDIQFLEVLTIENLQRDDVHPLEEAQGYQELMTRGGYDAKRIADRVGKSEKYVYDRIKLLQLIPEAQKLFLSDRFSAGHAILLARLSKKDQARALDPDESGLWTGEHTLWRPDEKDQPCGKYDELKARSVRELEGWIDTHVRLDPSRDNEVLVFPGIAEVVAPAEEAGEKVVPITFEHQLDPELKDEENRTFGPKMWKRADGLKGSKKCEHSIIGFLAVGPGRGDAFRVCIAKTKCTTHWPDEVKKAAKAKAKKPTASSSTKAAPEPKKPAWEIEREKREARHDAWKKLSPFVIEAAAAAVKKAPLSTLAEVLLHDIPDPDAKASKLIGRGKTAEDLVRWIAFGIVFENADNEYQGEEGFKDLAKLLRVDLAKIKKEHGPAPEKPAAKTAAKKRR